MNKFDRVIATLVLLQSKRLVTAAWLAAHFGVSVRTVYRDVHSLKTAGVPVIGDPGAGYSILEGYRLPPTALSRDEALALLTAGKFVGSLSDTELQAHHQSALGKLRAVLHGSDKEALANLEEGLAFQAQRTWEGHHYLQRLLACVAAKRAVQLHYQKADGTPSERIVEPIGCYHYYGRWYVAAYCRQRRDYRTFTVSRIQRFWALDEGFQQAHIPLQTYMERQQQQWKATQVMHDIELVFAEPILNFVDREKELYGVVREESCPGGRRLFLLNHSIEIVARWLMTYSSYVHVLRPAQLVHRLRELSTELYQHYQRPHTGRFELPAIGTIEGNTFV